MITQVFVFDLRSETTVFLNPEPTEANLQMISKLLKSKINLGALVNLERKEFNLNGTEYYAQKFPGEIIIGVAGLKVGRNKRFLFQIFQRIFDSIDIYSISHIRSESFNNLVYEEIKGFQDRTPDLSPNNQGRNNANSVSKSPVLMNRDLNPKQVFEINESDKSGQVTEKQTPTFPSNLNQGKNIKMEEGKMKEVNFQQEATFGKEVELEVMEIKKQEIILEFDNRVGRANKDEGIKWKGIREQKNGPYSQAMLIEDESEHSRYSEIVPQVSIQENIKVNLMQEKRPLEINDDKNLVILIEKKESEIQKISEYISKSNRVKIENNQIEDIKKLEVLSPVKIKSDTLLIVENKLEKSLEIFKKLTLEKRDSQLNLKKNEIEEIKAEIVNQLHGNKSFLKSQISNESRQEILPKLPDTISDLKSKELSQSIKNESQDNENNKLNLKSNISNEKSPKLSTSKPILNLGPDSEEKFENSQRISENKTDNQSFLKSRSSVQGNQDELLENIKTQVFSELNLKSENKEIANPKNIDETNSIFRVDNYSENKQASVNIQQIKFPEINKLNNSDKKQQNLSSISKDSSSKKESDKNIDFDISNKELLEKNKDSNTSDLEKNSGIISSKKKVLENFVGAVSRKSIGDVDQDDIKSERILRPDAFLEDNLENEGSGISSTDFMIDVEVTKYEIPNRDILLAAFTFFILSTIFLSFFGDSINVFLNK